MNPLLVHLVADFGGNGRSVGDLAFSEVESMLLLAPHVKQVVRTAVGAFNALEASFVTAQLGLDVDEDNGHRVLIFANVDSRSHTKDPIVNGDGAPFFVGELSNFVRILAPGFETFAIAKHLGILQKFEQINTAPFTENNRPGQFRSRDIYPKVIGALAQGRDIERSDADMNLIPEVHRRVGYIDAFGNIKTTVQQRECRTLFVTVTIGELTTKMPITRGLFDALREQIHMYPGSSGPTGNRFMEVGRRNGSAAEMFPDAAPGVRIDILEHPEYVDARCTEAAAIVPSAA